VMGAAVNRAACLQSMTKKLARSPLISADFAACIDEPVESLGCHPMKGVRICKRSSRRKGYDRNARSATSSKSTAASRAPQLASLRQFQVGGIVQGEPEAIG
jgi:hypothetical protein